MKLVTPYAYINVCIHDVAREREREAERQRERERERKLRCLPRTVQACASTTNCFSSKCSAASLCGVEEKGMVIVLVA